MEKYTKYIDLIRLMFKNSKEGAGGFEFRFYHSQQVAYTANILAKKLNLSVEEIDIVTIAGIFHDAGKADRRAEDGSLYASREDEIKFNLERHEDVSGRIAEKELKNDFNEEFIGRVKSIIINDKQDDILANILADADDLSEMGAINVWKMFSYSSVKNRSIEETVKYWEDTDFQRHTDKVEKFKLEISKEIGRERIDEVSRFMAGLMGEIGV